MSVISDEQLDRFITTYKKLYGEKLERQKAYELFMSLLNLYKLANKHIFDTMDTREEGLNSQ